jgi:excisionase family DNA binding protein
MDNGSNLEKDAERPATLSETMAKARAARGKGSRPRRTPPEPDVEPLAVKLPVAAKMLGIGITAMKQLIHSGRIRSIKLGTTRLIAVADLKKFLGVKDT